MRIEPLPLKELSPRLSPGTSTRSSSRWRAAGSSAGPTASGILRRRRRRPMRGPVTAAPTPPWSGCRSRAATRRCARRCWTSCTWLRADPPAAFLVWPREARAADVSIDVPYEPDRDIFGTLWQMKRAAPAGSGPAMKRITSRFMMLIATAAVLPLMVYGAVSMGRLKQGTADLGSRGQPRGRRAGRQPGQAVHRQQRADPAIGGEELNATSLAPWQQTRILTNHVLEFPEFREISILDASGRTIATSRLGEAHAKLPLQHERSTHGVHVTEVFLDDDALPTTDLALKLKSEDDQAAWLVGRLSLEELWRFVDRVRIGRQGLRLGVRRGSAADRARRSREEAAGGARHRSAAARCRRTTSWPRTTDRRRRSTRSSRMARTANRWRPARGCPN